MSIVIILNSPPQSGKDTVADIFMDLNVRNGYFKNVKRVSFKSQLIKKVCDFFNVDDYMWKSHYTSEGKEIKRDWLGGMGQREALIWMSEEVVKPKWGDDFFGKCAAQEVEDDGETIYIFTDGGFNEEIIPIAEKVGYDNVFIVTVYREGCTFENDSRSYIDIGTIRDLNYLSINNNSGMSHLIIEVEEFIEYMLITGNIPSDYLKTH